MGNKGKFFGMTTNERLFVAGIIEDFDKAAMSRDRNRMIELLGKVELADEAESITNTILAEPKRYGY